MVEPTMSLIVDPTLFERQKLFEKLRPERHTFAIASQCADSLPSSLIAKLRILEVISKVN